jgi:hypothetical protein
MKPSGGVVRPTLWRRALRVSDSLLLQAVLPHIGSGIAAKQYDPGAPFFIVAAFPAGSGC